MVADLAGFAAYATTVLVITPADLAAPKRE